MSAVQNRVSILLNAGGGTFGAATPVSVGMFPLGTAIGDFDEDGDLDLTVTNASDSTIQVLTNNGSGVFAPGTATAVGGSPEAVTVGDVNSDGHLDVVAANQVQPDVNILFGDGMGGFAVGSEMVGASQDGVALDDLNGDGRLDILTETFGLGSVTALLNLTGTQIVTPSAGEMVSGVDFGNFAVKSRLGVGSFGEVKLAVWHRRGRCGGVVRRATRDASRALDLAADGKPIVIDVGTWFCEPCKGMAEYFATGDATVMDEFLWWEMNKEKFMPQDQDHFTG